jgi:1,4-dihydroxy-2-naphthoyl-CoA hydrolase
MSALDERLDLRRLEPGEWVSAVNAEYDSGLTGLLGCELAELAPGKAVGRLELRDELMVKTGAPLHGGTVAAFADTCTGWGCLATLPDGVSGFATGAMTLTLVGTALAPGALTCEATLLHGGRTTQVWDAVVAREADGRPVAHFRATQHLLGGRR